MTYTRTYCCVQCWTLDDGQRDCPKHVDSQSKNKFEILMHLFGFIIRIYHDSRPSERQILQIVCIVFNAYIIKYMDIPLLWCFSAFLNKKKTSVLDGRFVQLVVLPGFVKVRRETCTFLAYTVIITVKYIRIIINI